MIDCPWRFKSSYQSFYIYCYVFCSTSSAKSQRKLRVASSRQRVTNYVTRVNEEMEAVLAQMKMNQSDRNKRRKVSVWFFESLFPTLTWNAWSDIVWDSFCVCMLNKFACLVFLLCVVVQLPNGAEPLERRCSSSLPIREDCGQQGVASFLFICERWSKGADDAMWATLQWQ